LNWSQASTIVDEFNLGQIIAIEALQLQVSAPRDAALILVDTPPTCYALDSMMIQIM
jgi:hypothetical protein